MTFLVTGAAGFIGMHTARALLERGDHVIGIDNLNDYYDPALKQARLDVLKPYENFTFQKLDISDSRSLNDIFKHHDFETVIHLAAQAGVRYSIDNPHAYIQSNIIGFANILEACRHYGHPHLIYASSSSVYGGNTKVPFSETDPVDHPVSLYAATKKSNELTAHAYTHLYGFPTTGLRFFTVYGPWGRPDMAPYIFTKNVLNGDPITVFNHGHHARDFTYIDDIVDGVMRCVPASKTPYRLYNIGRGQSEPLMDFIQAVEQATERKATLIFKDMQAGDVKTTHADICRIHTELGYNPTVSITDGVAKFVEWFKAYAVS